MYNYRKCVHNSLIFLPGMLIEGDIMFGISVFTLKSIASSSIRTSELSEAILLLLLVLLDIGDTIRVAYSFDKPITNILLFIHE